MQKNALHNHIHVFSEAYTDLNMSLKRAPLPSQRDRNSSDRILSPTISQNMASDCALGFLLFRVT